MSSAVTEKGRIVPSARFTNSYRIKPRQVEAGSSLALARTPSGNPILFVTGKTGGVAVIKRDTTGATGWQQIWLNGDPTTPQFKAQQVWSTELSSGQIIVYAVDDARILHRGVYGDSPIQWQEVPVPQGYLPIEPFLRTGFGQATASYFRQFRHGYGYLFTVIDGDGYTTPPFYQTLRDYQIVMTSSGLGQAGCYYLGNQEYTGTYSVSGGRQAIFSTMNLATCSLEGAPSEIFGTGLDLKLYYFAQPTTPSDALTAVPIGGDLQFTTIAAAYSQEVPQVFGISFRTQKLYHVRAIPGPGGAWSRPFPLFSDRQFQQILASRDTDGNSEVFALDTQGTLCRIWQDASSGDWHITNITLPGDGTTAESFPAFASQFSLQSEDGAPLINTQVQLWASESVSVTVNGKGAVLSPDTPFVAASNGFGQVNVVAEADSIYTPEIRITTDFLEAGKVVAIKPDSALRDFFTDPNRFNEIAVRNATLQTSGNPSLLPASQNTQAIAETIVGNVSRSLSLHQVVQPSGTASSHPYLDLSAISEQHWEVNFSGATPSFRILTAQQAADLIAHHESSHVSLEAAFGIPISWSSMISTLKEGAAQIASMVVSTVVQQTSKLGEVVVTGIKALVTLTYESSTYVYQGAVRLAEQVYDLAEVTFDRFEAGFNQLFEWLGELVGWEDIRRTQQAIKYVLLQGLELLPAVVDYSQKKITDYLGVLKGAARTGFEQTMADIAASPRSLAQDLAELTPNPTIENALSNNILLNMLMDTAGPATTPLAAQNIPPAFKQLMESWTDYSKTLEQNGIVNNCRDLIAPVAEGDVDGFLRQSILALLKITSQLLTAVIDLTQLIVTGIAGVLKSLLELLQQTFTNDYPFPVLNPVYRKITGEPTMSPAGLVSLILAIPATPIYKAFNRNQPPFIDDQALENFKADVSAKAIIDALNGKSLRTSLAAGGPPVAMQTRNLLVVFGYASIAIQGKIAGGLDAVPPDKTDNIGVALLSWTALVLEILGWVQTCPYFFNSTFNPLPVHMTSENVAAFIWVCLFEIILVDGVTCLWSNKKSSLWFDQGAILNMIIGAEYCVVYAWYAIIQGVEQKLPPATIGTTFAANFLIASPLTLKISRASVVYYSTPWGKVVNTILAVAEFLMIPVGAVISIYLNYDATSPVLFTDDFKPPVGAKQWTVLSGTWSVTRPDSKGKYAYEMSDPRADGTSVAGNDSWDNYSVQVWATLSDINGGLALLGRLVDGANYYQLELKKVDSTTNEVWWWLWSRKDGSFVQLKNGPFQYKAGDPVLLRLEVSHGLIEAQWSKDGNEFVTLGRVSNPYFAKGKIGLRAYGSEASFRDVIVERLT